jgi:hypothetical protein
MAINVVSVRFPVLKVITEKNLFITAYETMSFAILTPNFPTHVPPYFCTSHLASGLIVFWCRFGGVLGGEDDNEEEEDDGVDIKKY